ncbi:hypothetical protein [Roseivirga sp. E12]|uniref:hypothetical protein n=1 Tax=Roseivirga sp. E12 TaxID=2819237 RepID=UPI001ABC72CF|nr:hypothetical protein [Roseivirga sp. E12]MBO3700799.1 hypothetical protein [Roseivirga sp. E12]
MAKQRTSLIKFIAELLIVFVGVYGAFELNRYQETKRETKIRERYFSSFSSELNKLSFDISNTQKTIDKALTNFQTAIENGEKPTPKPLNIIFEAPMLITRAGFNDDVFIQLDASLAASLSGGYDNVQLVIKQIERFNQLCDRQLISNTPITFYDRQANLKPEFHWYQNELSHLQGYMRNLDKMINEGAIPAVKKLIE